LIVISLIKCADISNEIRQPHLAKKWASLVLQEFITQGKKERELQWDVTPFMDTNKIIISKEQINFIEKLCLPLYSQVAVIFPKMTGCCNQLTSNRDGWNKRLLLFFSEDTSQIKRLSSKSIWEREQVKAKGEKTDLASTLRSRASRDITKPRRANKKTYKLTNSKKRDEFKEREAKTK